MMLSNEEEVKNILSEIESIENVLVDKTAVVINNMESEEELNMQNDANKQEHITHVTNIIEKNDLLTKSINKNHKCYTVRVRGQNETHQCVHTCDICGKKFRNKDCAKFCQDKLKKNADVDIPNNRFYLCEICGKHFAFISAFIAHYNHKHADQNLFLKHQQNQKCNICGKLMSTKWNLKTHMMSHLDVRPYLCEFCGKRYKKQTLLTMHVRTHTGNRPYHCTICSKQFTTKSVLSAHLRTHTGERPFPCEFCNRRYTGYTALKIHRRSHTGEKPYRCDLCPSERAFASKRKLLAHLKQPHHECNINNNNIYGKSADGELKLSFPAWDNNIHQSETYNENLEIKIEPIDINWEDEEMTLMDLKSKMGLHIQQKLKSRTEQSDKVYRSQRQPCILCNSIIRGRSAMINHYLIHKEEKIKSNVELIKQVGEEDFFRCCVCMKEFVTKAQLNKHSEYHVQRPFFCEKCNKSFKQTQNFLSHIDSHQANNEMKCGFCEFTTTFKLAYDQHVKSHSRQEYKCDECNKVFAARTWFLEHRNFHTGEKPFSCEECGKCFPYSRYLTAHKKSMHPHCYFKEPELNECPICKKRYSHKNSLRLHMKSHTGENTYLCDICGKKLSSTDKLQLHRRIHTGFKPYACTVCEKRFTKKDILTDHLRVHSGEKPFSCETCGKCFSQRSPLTIHRRYHTGERPYVCHLCNKGFVSKGILGIHLKQGKH